MAGIRQLVVPVSSQPLMAVFANLDEPVGYVLHPVVLFSLTEGNVPGPAVAPMIVLDSLVVNVYECEAFLELVFDRDITPALRQKWTDRSRQLITHGFEHDDKELCLGIC
jgi:hypothetical protein